MRLFTAAACLLAACGTDAQQRTPQGEAATCGDAAAQVVRNFGTRLRLVSTLADTAVVRESLVTAYGDLVSPGLLAEWQHAPSTAPGRSVSNPWPARIAVNSVEQEGENCRVRGDIVEVTTADTSTADTRLPVRILVSAMEPRRILAFEADAAGRAPVPPAEADTTPEAAIRGYYNAIAAGRFDEAYRLWWNNGAASNQTRDEFANGFTETAQVSVNITGVVTREGAAGSQYATVPVRIDAVLRNGRRQRFEGSYTLRRSLVDGATEAQRSWRIYNASLRDVPS